MSLDADYVILGGGFYGMYGAGILAERGARIILIEKDNSLFSRASYINQARIHFGYHYPRSLHTAAKSAAYFSRFNKDFAYCVNSSFKKIYAISSVFTYTGTRQFERFCQAANIPCKPIDIRDYFNPQYVDGAYETTEYTYDARMLCEHLLNDLQRHGDRVRIIIGAQPRDIRSEGDSYHLELQDGTSIRSPRILNATYASINQVSELVGAPKVPIKYELCEVILCETNEGLRDVGITVMDGPFFSIMPFGHTGKHSLTTVAFTPHLTSYSALPTFPCQDDRADCSPASLSNCNTCPDRPTSAWPYMSQLAKKYLASDLRFSYHQSLFSMKPILLASELDDSRPTVILKHGGKPVFRSVLSGKINTVYDIKQGLLDDLKA